MKKILLIITMFFMSLNANNDTNSLDNLNIKDIRSEVKNLEKSILGKSFVTEVNSPKLYSLVSEVAQKMEQKVPEIIIAKGLFTPKFKNEHKLNILLESSMPLNLVFILIGLKLLEPQLKNIKNFELRFLTTMILVEIFSIVLNNLLIGQQSITNAYSSIKLNGQSLIYLGENLLNTLDVEELKNIIAHELAHFKHKHLLKLAGLAIPLLYLHENQKTKGKWNSFFVIFPIIAFISRMFEKEADLTAVKITSSPDKMVSALSKLTKLQTARAFYLYDKNLPNDYKALNKDSKINTVINTLTGSHPTLQQRANYLMKKN